MKNIDQLKVVVHKTMTLLIGYPSNDITSNARHKEQR